MEGCENRFEGIYDPPTAARILQAARMGEDAYPVPSRTLIRWIRQGLTDPDLASAPGREMVLSFEDLVSLRVIAAMRAAGVPWRAIHLAEQWLRKATSYPRPFAREELWTSKSDVFSKFKGMLVSASQHGQLAMESIVDYLIPVAGLSFENHIARTWAPRDLILIDPKVQFGEACIKGTRIPASSVASMVNSGDSRASVMRAYQLSQDELEAALDWAESVAA